VRSLDVQDGWLYVGGTMTHLTGGSSPKAVAAKNLGRVSVADATPGTGWNPRLNGTVNDVDASSDGTRVYAAGYFSTADGVAARRGAALSSSPGAAVLPFSPTWSSTKNDYQRSVLQVGNRVYFGGSEHSLFGYDPTTMDRVSGSIMKRHGDIQVVATGAPGVIFAGCHCNSYSYQNAFTWPTLSGAWTQADALNWFGAWDAATGARIPQFVPQFDSRLGSGVWAITTDSRGVVWAGGDLTTATTKSGARRWTGGFVRYDPADSTAPGVPTGLRATGSTDTTVTLAWDTVTDRGSGGVRYQVLRDDRTVGATADNTGTLTVERGGSNRFFVRAVDAAGNVSASTAVTVTD